MGCFGLTEPDHGSDPAGMETTAVSDGAGGYVINGSKTWISNSPIADVFLIFAKDATNNNEIQGFVLTKGMEGLTAPKILVSFKVKGVGQAVSEEFGHRDDYDGRGESAGGE